VSVIARERSDRSNLTVLRGPKNDAIAALPLVARNDDRGTGGLTSDFHAHGRAEGACGIPAKTAIQRRTTGFRLAPAMRAWPE